MNALTEPSIIHALCRASQAGVEIDLIVRGICCLRPGVRGYSERIRVRSLVGRFLEHARVWWFGSSETLFCSSADWMERNLQRRVEAAFPLPDARLRHKIRRECLELALRDNTGAWALQADGSWVALRDSIPQEAFAVQDALIRGETDRG
jgi:polyphosphate kinase